MTDTILATAAAAPVITALVAVIGQALPSLPRRLYPLVAISLGVAWAVISSSAVDGVAWNAIVEGTLVGLAASGLYSGAIKPLEIQRYKPTRVEDLDHRSKPAG